MASSLDKLESLRKELSRLSTAEDKVKSVMSWLKASTREPPRTVHDARTETHDKINEERQVGDRLINLMNEHGIFDKFRESHVEAMSSAMRHEIQPFAFLPCANVDAARTKTCPLEGKQACSACKLVKYCSKTCQTQHWKVHKRDCKDPLRSEAWVPCWVEENRSPVFVTEKNTNPLQQLQPQAYTRSHLWGNMPAYDLLASGQRKVQQDADYTIAFAASGDLRNVVRTVNSLPTNYSGHLTIVMNDRDPQVTFRNMVLLVLLGSIADAKVAAELALHLWYSVCVPAEYRSAAALLARQLFDNVEPNSPFRKSLGQNSDMSGKVSQDVIFAFATTMINPNSYIGDAAQEYERVNLDPSRVDHLHRWLSPMDLSHRVAYMEHRRFGLVLPFGAPNAHFNTPNSTLFSPHGQWLQNDSVSPLEGWDLSEVLETGQRRGTSREDVYGCFYFFMLDQLQQFAKHIQGSRISFYLFDEDALDLSKAILNGDLLDCGIPSTTRFDRIDVSNIMDAEYVGISKCISHWSVLLASRTNSTLLGSFMNWFGRVDGGRLTSSGNMTKARRLMSEAMVELRKDGRLPILTSQSEEARAVTMLTILSDLEAKYDNSKAFEEFLKSHGMIEALKKAHCIRRKKHFIVPHRLCARISDPSSALPHFPDKESWYLNTVLSHSSWSERFVEITRT